jgi:hypothetical protein
MIRVRDRVRENLVRLFLLVFLLALLALSTFHVASHTAFVVGDAPAVAITCNGGSQSGCGGG